MKINRLIIPIIIVVLLILAFGVYKMTINANAINNPETKILLKTILGAGFLGF